MIGWQDEAGDTHRGTLFAAFAALASGQAHSFPALRPHQREPWHAFTVQVAALALIRAGTDTLPTGEAAWRDLLLALTPDGPEAWELVVDDWSKPALLQPPTATPADRAAYKNRLPTPDTLDMLVTAKNHDLKQARMVGADDEHWLFALVTLQTTEGFLGAGNYGISRMNGGFASRMSLGIRPAGGAGQAFRRDVERLLADARARTDRRTGTPLLWTVPWDGALSLNYNELDELYVEICRRVRLRRTPTGIEALTAGSKAARVAASELKGRTRDPWAPMKADGSTSHTPTGAGFGYRQMANLLDKAKITLPPLAHADPADAPDGLSIVAAALVRGQGKTEGLHRRTIRTHGARRDADGRPIAIERIGEVARKRADEGFEASRRLSRALISLVQGGPERARLDDDSAKKKTERWLARFNDAVDGIFFDAPFWDEVWGATDNPRMAWRITLRDIARDVFDMAAEAAPGTEVRRMPARARAGSLLHYEMKKWVEDAEYGE
jgi:CRISPR system Cascade subunit CasA